MIRNNNDCCCSSQDLHGAAKNKWSYGEYHRQLGRQGGATSNTYTDRQWGQEVFTKGSLTTQRKLNLSTEVDSLLQKLLFRVFSLTKCLYYKKSQVNSSCLHLSLSQYFLYLSSNQHLLDFVNICIMFIAIDNWTRDHDQARGHLIAEQ